MANPFLIEDQEENTPKQQSSNPFLVEEASPEQQPSAMTSEPQTNSFMAGVEAFNRQFSKMALGGLDLAAQGIGAVGSVLPNSVGDYIEKDAASLRNNIATYNQSQQQSLNKTQEQHPIASTVGTVAGAIGTGVAYGGPGVSSAATLPMKAAVGAAEGSALGMMDYAPSNKERLVKGAVGGLLGAAIPVAGHYLGKLGRKLVKPKATAAEDLAGKIGAQVGDDVSLVDDAVAMTNKVKGSKLTAGEAFPETVGGFESTLKPGEAVKNKDVIPRYLSQQKNTKQAIQETIENMAPKDAANVEKTLWKQLEDIYVTPTGEITDEASKAGMPEVVKNSKELLSRYEGLLKAESKAYKNLPNNSVAKLAKIKTSIYDELYPDTKGLVVQQKSLSPDRKLALSEAAEEIENLLSKSEVYNQASHISQQIRVKNKWLDKISEKAIKTNQAGEMSLDEIRQTIFSSPKVQNQFLQDVGKTGGDPEMAKAVIDLTDRLSKSPLEKIMKAQYTGSAEFQRLYGANSSTPGLIEKGMQVIDRAINKRYYDAMLELTLSNEWVPKVKEILQKPDQLESFKDLIVDLMKKGTRRAVSMEGGRGLLEKAQ